MLPKHIGNGNYCMHKTEWISWGLLLSLIIAIVSATTYLVSANSSQNINLAVMDEKVKVISDNFIPRGELNERLSNIERDVSDIKSDIRKIANQNI